MDPHLPALAAAASEPPSRVRPTYTIAYVFADPSQPLPIFESLPFPPAVPAFSDAPQVIEAAGDGRSAASRHETPEPPVAAPPPPEPPAAPPQQEQPATGQPGAPDSEASQRQPLPRGEAEKRALAYLREHPDDEVTPGQVAKAIDARGCRDLMARLCERGVVTRTSEKPLKYRAAALPPA